MLLTADADLGRRVSDLAFLLKCLGTSLVGLLLCLLLLQDRLGDGDVVLSRDRAECAETKFSWVHGVQTRVLLTSFRPFLLLGLVEDSGRDGWIGSIGSIGSKESEEQKGTRCLQAIIEVVCTCLCGCQEFGPLAECTDHCKQLQAGRHAPPWLLLPRHRSTTVRTD